MSYNNSLRDILSPFSIFKGPPGVTPQQFIKILYGNVEINYLSYYLYNFF